MSTLYITPDYLTNYPSSVDWTIIPDVGASKALQAEALTEICQRATAIADNFCGQILCASINTEQSVTGDGRLTIDPNSQNGVYRTQFGPILSVVSAEVSSNAAFPPSWSTLSSDNARIRGAFSQSYPFPNAGGVGPKMIDIAPGYIVAQPQTLLSLVYVNGYPHAALAQSGSVASGSTVIKVDQVVGFAGGTGWIYDTVNTELVSIASVTATNGSTGVGAYGPGTLTLDSPTLHSHANGVLISAFPADFLDAVAMLAIARTMLRGSTAVVMATLSGSSSSTGNSKAATYIEEARAVLRNYRIAK